MALEVIRTIQEMQQVADAMRRAGRTISLVPTMGYLHDGHASLIRRAVMASDTVITSVFVNQLQFAPNEDFSRYPRDYERDYELIRKAGGNFLFFPDPADMYPEGFGTSVFVGKITRKFEGEYRPGHFEGVATVVAKLLLATKPHRAYFGQKDYQQTLVVRRLVRDLNMDIMIETVPTIRERDGLAMSSRNVYLSDEQRIQSTILYQALSAGLEQLQQGNYNRQQINDAMHQVLQGMPQFQVQYCVAAQAETLEEPDIFTPDQSIVLLAAGYLGTTRLIDNMIWLPQAE
jgi:pantoate--beta-alanine ligase